MISKDSFNSNLIPNKRLGQNFLVDDNIIRKIVSHVPLSDIIVEVGPGQGALTKLLVDKAKQVVAYEIDKRLADFLASSDALKGKLVIHNEDFLKADFTWLDKAFLVGNLPYYITTDILFKLFENIHFFSGAIIMVQKEFGERMMAAPNTPNYSKLAVSTSFLANATKIMDVPRTVFNPRPEVDSVVLHLTFKNPDLPISPFLNFVKQAFAHRRKTLVNNFKNFMPAAFAEQLVAEQGHDLRVRPQELALNEFVNLYKEALKLGIKI